LGILVSSLVAPAPLGAQHASNLWEEVGIASWYGPGFTGRPTASGETYDPTNLTAAHKSLPLGSLVRVHNLENDRDMIVRINDRGPFVHGRVIDLSEAAASVLGFRDDGLTRVRLTHVSGPVSRPVRVAVPPNRGSRSLNQARRPTTPAVEDTAPVGANTTGEESFDEAIAEATDQAPVDPSEPPRYYLQLAAFKESRRANDFVHSAGPLGMALLVEYNGGMYRVLAGPFESHAAAEQARRDVARAGIEAFVRAEY
jgi:rare lipoprotein A